MIVFLGNGGTLPKDAPADAATVYGVLVGLCFLAICVPMIWTVVWIMLMINGLFVDWANGLGWSYAVLGGILAVSVVYGFGSVYLVPFIKNKIAKK